MSYNTNELEEFALSLPITQTARRTAQQFATQQPTAQKQEQVRLNTLAVCAVNDYLQAIGLSTDLPASDSWNPVVRLCADVADLEVVGVGRIECRPVKDSEPTCYVPPEVWSDRIGYVVVQIDDTSLNATVLGFSSIAVSEELPLSQLEPIEGLIDRLYELMHPVTVESPVATQTSTVATPALAPRTRANLSQWLTNVFETGWQTLESLLSPAEPDLAFSFRSADSSALADPEPLAAGVRRAKLINLQMESTDLAVVLIVEVRPESERRSNILLQVHPTGGQAYLPQNLQLLVLDESGSIFLEAQARSNDNYIQLEFSGQPGEQFSIKVELGESSFIEDFVI